MLSVILLYECRVLIYCYAECHYAECRGTSKHSNQVTESLSCTVLLFILILFNLMKQSSFLIGVTINFDLLKKKKKKFLTIFEILSPAKVSDFDAIKLFHSYLTKRKIS
jgi:hypothetical protein